MRIPRLTRRDLLVAGIAAASTLGAASLLRSQSHELSSSVFDWARLEARPTSTGERRSILRSRTATLENLSVHVTTIRAGIAPHAPHRHPDEEMILVKEGTLQIDIEGRVQRVGAGSLIFVAPGDEHGILNVGDRPASYYIIRWISGATARAAK